MLFKNTINPSKNALTRLAGVLLLLFSLDSYAWYNTSWNYRVPVNVPVGATVNSTIKLSVDFVALLTTLGKTGTLDVNSLRVVRSDDLSLSATQEFTDTLYNGTTDLAGNGRGEIKFLLQDAGATTYYLYFDITLNGSKAVNPQTSINGNFEQGATGTQSPSAWTVVKANAAFDAQVRPSESLSIVDTGGSNSTVTTDGTPLTGAFSYLLGGRTNAEAATASPSVTLSRSFIVPTTSPGNLVLSYRSEGWDSSDNSASQWDYLRIKLVGSTTTEIVGPTYGNYVTFPFSPNKGTGAISTAASGYGNYNYWDMSSNGTHRSGMTLAAGSQSWFTRTVALTAYAGQTITLQITMNESTGYKSWAHIDDVEWSVINATLGTPSMVPLLHHVVIQHGSGTGLTCAANTLTIKACQDAACTTAYTGGLSGTLTAAGTPVPTWDGTTGGATGAGFVIPVGSSTVTKNVQVTTAGTVVFDTTALSLSATSSTTCNFGSPSCTFTISKAGFLFSNTTTGTTYTIPTQVSGVSSGTLYLRSIQASTANAAVCALGTAGSTTPVIMGYTCNNPVSCQSGSLVTVNSTAVSSSGSSVSLTFDTNASAPVTVRYDDVGQITLNASSTTGTLTGSSNSFVVKPSGFVLSGIKQTASPQLANPVAADALGSKFVKAGEAFTVTVTSTNAFGNATPNYGKEIAPENVSLSNPSPGNPVAPTGGNNPAVTGTFGSFAGGAATGTAFKWNEVGIIKLTPSVLGGDYLGVGDITGTTSGNIGRFYASSFKLSSTTLVNRADITGCVAPCGIFTYIGEQMNAVFTLTAMAADGTTVLSNYTSASQFAKLNPTSTGNPLGLGAVDVATIRTPFPVCGASPVHPCIIPITATSGSFALGVANISVPLAVYRGVTPVGAYTLLDVGVAPLDSDGSILSAYDLDTVNVLSVANNHAIIGRTQVRYGRIRLQNAYGSELLDLPMPLTAEYWDGTSWITNTDEQYTKDLTMSATVVTGPLTTVCAWDTGLGIGNSGLGCSVAGTSLNQYRAPPTGGDFNLNFKAPGSGNTGTMEITATVPSYLMFNWKGVGNANPIAIANFGIYKGNSKIIYIRELY